MATGFKLATVNSARVPSTQTNFPAYVDLSRLGITTLAEAQSVRVYADVGKTTEWARDVVSATEMYVKIPSLTNTSSIYIDYDGVRSNYAATDTFGRNNVWTNYSIVTHLDEASGTRIDAAGNDDLTDVNTVPNATGKLGTNAANFTRANSERLVTTTANITTGDTPVELEIWHKTSLTSTYRVIQGLTGTAGGRWFLEAQIGTDNLLDVEFGFVNGGNQGVSFTTSTATVTDGNWHHYVVKISNNASRAEIKLYQDGSLIGTGTHASLSYSLPSDFTAYTIGAARDWSTGTYTHHSTGDSDEARLRVGNSTSDNFTLVSYNNQNNESDFWGTWSDVGFSVNISDTITPAENTSLEEISFINQSDTLVITENQNLLLQYLLDLFDVQNIQEDGSINGSGFNSLITLSVSDVIIIQESINSAQLIISVQLPENRASGRVSRIKMKWGGSI